MRNAGWAAPILTATAIFVQGIGDSVSARAETKAAAKKPVAGGPPLSPHWNHNGSVVSLVSAGGKQKFVYDTPRVGLLDAGVKQGTLLFEGQRNGQNITGTAFQFYRTCKAHTFEVSGSASEDRKTITLKGKAPLLDMNCNVMGSREDVLIFTSNQTAPTEPPKETPVASASGTKATAQTPHAVVSEAKKPAAAPVAAPSAPPEVSKATAAPVVESNSAKSSSSSAASNTVVVTKRRCAKRGFKDKQAATARRRKNSATSRRSETASHADRINDDEQPGSSGAAAPPTEPAKANQSTTVPSANAGPPKSEVPAPATSVAAPKVEPPKVETQRTLKWWQS